MAFEGSNALRLKISLVLLGTYALLFVPYWQALVVGGVIGCSIHFTSCRLRKKYAFFGRKWEIAGIACFFLFSGLMIYEVCVHILHVVITRNEDQNLLSQIAQSFAKAKMVINTGIQNLLGPGSIPASSTEQFVSDGLTQLQTGLINSVQAIITNLPGAFLAFAAAMTAGIYFALGAPHTLDQLSPFKVLSRHSPISWQEFEAICSYSLGSLLVIGFAQASIITLACMAIGTSNLVLIFFVTFFLSFIPLLGASSVPFVMMIYYYSIGDLSSSLAMLGAFGVGSTIDNVLRALLFSKLSNNNVIISFFAVIGAILLFGLPGLLIAPVLEQIAMKAFAEVLHQRNPPGGLWRKE